MLQWYGLGLKFLRACHPQQFLLISKGQGGGRDGIAYCESAQGQGLMEEGAVYDRKHEIVF